MRFWCSRGEFREGLDEEEGMEERGEGRSGDDRF